MKLKKKTWLAIIIFSLLGQVAWTVENMLFNVFIQEEFNASLNDIALMVSASAIAATLTTLLIGALSDKIGKRKLFICLGYIIWGISICAFALLKVEELSRVFYPECSSYLMAASLGISLTIIFDCAMTFFGSSANDACFNAWLTDISDDTNRGKIEGVNSAMPLIAILIVFGGRMLVQGSDNEWTIIFLVVGILISLAGVFGFFVIEDSPKEIKSEESYFKNIFYGFRPSVIKENAKLYIALAGFLVFCTSVQVFMPYLILYFENTIHLDNYVLVFAPAIVLAAIFTIFYGKLIDKYGFTKTSIISICIYIVGLLVLLFFTNIILVFIGTLLMMMGYLSGTACFNSSIRKYTPESKVGLFQGVRIVVQVLIPMLIGPWIGSLLSGNASEGFLGVAGDAYTPSSLIYLGAAVVGVFIYLFIFWLGNKIKKED